MTEQPADFLRLIDIERIDANIFRSNLLLHEQHALYGGQVAAQALRAAGLTVSDDRTPHSLHGYFLRAGDTTRPTIFRVYRDRDGRSYSARRVVAVQGGEVIFNLAASFHIDEDGLDEHTPALPQVADASSCPGWDIPRLQSFEGRLPEQPIEALRWPIRFWARCSQDLGREPLLNACALTYLSDISTGLAAFERDGFGAGSSLDHALWFHRPAFLSEWVLSEYAPVSVAGGRGTYTGSFFDPAGRLLASVAQEALFRRRESRP